MPWTSTTTRSSGFTVTALVWNNELGEFTCPVCGYSWEDARELYPGVWNDPSVR